MNFSISGFQYLSVFIALSFLWYRLIDHLRVEWTVNPQYTYGWAVPFLCLFLLWHRLDGAAEDGVTSRTAEPSSAFPRFNISVFCLLLAFLYFPTRLIQEANPEWRLVSWALALEVVGLTLLFCVAGDVRGRNTSAFQFFSLSAVQRSPLTFPVLFFLVAVPWPTVIEGPLIQALMRANAAATVEVVNLFGVPALQHGNVIEVGTGMVGIDEACSGIRSFQVVPMLALFFGEVYRLTVPRRIALCVIGFALSFVFNVARTTLLTCVAAAKGAPAIASWHDPAGAAILVACFLSLFLIARAARSPSPPQEERAGERRPFLSVSAFQRLSLPLLFWVAFSEIGTELWYRIHESHLPAPVTWVVDLPRGNDSLRELPLSEKTRQFLRCDEAVNAVWDEGGLHFQAIFLRWKPGRTAVHLAKTHTPEVCVTAAGREMRSKSDVQFCTIAGLELPFRSYVFDDVRGPLHVYYCLWEDRAPQRTFDTFSLTYGNRLAPVLAGRRLSGQRSLELAIWGCADPETAEAAMRTQLGTIVRR